VIPTTLWAGAEEYGFNQDGVRELRELGLDFPTPKPEKLIKAILTIGSNPGDLILDSFLGSGTTAAVAQKMGRRYIGIEMGSHAVTHCAPRLNKVIDGEQGGISESIRWKGGGGFRFFRIGEPAFDVEGRIRDGIRFPVLAAHIWFSETGQPWNGKGKSPLLGFHGEQAFALLYNGILGDKTPKGGNVLTRETHGLIRERIVKKKPGFDGMLTIYGEASRLSDATLGRQNIVFKQTPYDVKARK
jgi:adenine-specific DNA-methyltransferase